MPYQDGEPPIVKRERKRGALLAIVAILVLLGLALFLLLGDRVVSVDEPLEATNEVVRVEPEG